MQTLVEFVAIAEEKVVDNFDSYMMEFQTFMVQSGVIDYDYPFLCDSCCNYYKEE